MLSNKRPNKISIALVLSILGMFINYAISFLLTPYITEKIGTEAYGFVTLAKTVSNYGIVITGCLNAYAARFITLSFHKKDLSKATLFFSTVVISNFVLLILASLIDVIFVYKIQSFIYVSSDILVDVRILFAIDIFNYVFLALVNSFTVSLYICDRLDIVEGIKVIAYIVEAIMLFMLFSVFSPRVCYVGISMLISTIIIGVLNIVFYKRKTPELKISINSFSWKAFKELVLSGVWNSINSIGNLLNSGLDLWVTNLMLSTYCMGQLSIVKTISTIFSALVSLISRPFQPKLLYLYSKSDKKGLVVSFKNQMKLSSYFSNVLFAGLMVYGVLYYRLWTPTEDSSLLYNITVVTIIGFIFEGMVQPLFYSYTLTLKNRLPCIVTVISGLLNVLGMYLLLKYTNAGLFGVVGTTTVLGFITFGIFTPINVARVLDVKWFTFYDSIIQIIISALLMSVVLYQFSKIYMPSSWIGLILVAFSSAIICIPIHIICVFNISQIKEKILMVVR